MNKGAKTILVFTSLAPVGITYAFAAWFGGQRGEAIIAGLLAAAAISICLQLIRYAKTHFEKLDNITVVSIETADSELTALVLLYLLPLFTANLNQLNWELWAFGTLFIAALVFQSYSYHFNPVLGLFGWHFYKIGTPEGVSYVVITKRHITSKASTINTVQLTEFVLLDREELS
ncbi:MAG: hypothetical protein H7831_03750 [Magnetococcus sp. WYHC-3]